MTMPEIKFCIRCDEESVHTREDLPPTDEIMEINGDHPIEYVCTECGYAFQEL